MLATLDALLLARVQFAFTVMFHIIFPSFSIGLASYLAVLELLWLKTGKAIYLQLFKYWMKIFAVAFAMGVVSGIVMSYQFGTNWSVFSDKVGPVIGPLMGYEVMTAFFLEAGFLGVMLFGMERVGRKLHFTATLMVAVGTLLSTFWILAANSWMQTPTGHTINNVGQFVPVDWMKIVFNPSFTYRLVHMIIAAFLTTALVVAATGSYHLLKNNQNLEARLMLSMAMWMIVLVAPLQIVAGDLHGLNTLEHQPAKVAAMEGHFDTQKGAPLILFGIPDMEAQKTHYAIQIPKLGSLILTHDLEGELKGLKHWPKDDRPNATIVFWSFRIMVALGMSMLLIGITSVWLRRKRKLYTSAMFHKTVVLLGPTGFVAVLAGWITTEVGRQPFTVYGLLRTSDSVAPVAAPAVAMSLLAFIICYFILFGTGTWYLLKMMRRPPNTLLNTVATDNVIRSAGITPAPSIKPNILEGKTDD